MYFIRCKQDSIRVLHPLQGRRVAYFIRCIQDSVRVLYPLQARRVAYFIRCKRGMYFIRCKQDSIRVLHPLQSRRVLHPLQATLLLHPFTCYLVNQAYCCSYANKACYFSVTSGKTCIYCRKSVDYIGRSIFRIMKNYLSIQTNVCIWFVRGVVTGRSEQLGAWYSVHTIPSPLPLGPLLCLLGLLRHIRRGFQTLTILNKLILCCYGEINETFLTHI